MKTSSLLLLPTVLAVSTSARKPATRESSNLQPANTIRTRPKNLSIDFVFTVGK